MHWLSKHILRNSTMKFSECATRRRQARPQHRAQCQALQQHIRGWINRRWRVNRGRRWGWQRWWWRICGRVIWWPVGGIPRASADAACKQCLLLFGKALGEPNRHMCSNCHDDSVTSILKDRVPSLKSQQAAMTLPSPMMKDSKAQQAIFTCF